MSPWRWALHGLPVLGGLPLLGLAVCSDTAAAPLAQPSLQDRAPDLEAANLAAADLAAMSLQGVGPRRSGPLFLAQTTTPELAKPEAATPQDAPAVRVLFDPADALRLTRAAQADLAAFAERLHQNPQLRMQLIAFAGLQDHSPARRLSLSRALVVREFLIDQGVRSTQMTVRALGNTSPDGPADRVDIFQVGP